MLEAAALGKPMIVTKVGALEDYFDEKAAYYVEPFNTQQLRDAVNALVDDPARALAQAREACEQLQTRDLTTENFARQHAQLTRDMLRERDPRTAQASRADAVNGANGGHAAGQMPRGM
ncbi:glycosyltransferase, partial [Paraburkholderia sp.]